MYTQINEINLVSDLLYVLGVNMNPIDNVLLDQDTNNPILFEGKNIKATRDINKHAYISSNDIKLEPVNPKCVKLMSRLLGFFLSKEHENGNIPNAVSFYLEDVDIEKETQKLVIKFEDGTFFESASYRNKALIYTDAIMRLDGSFPIDHLGIFELDEDVDVRR